MSTTAQTVFDLAIGLMDEVDESTGNTDTADNVAYKQRTLLILNVLRGELYGYSATYTKTASGTRPMPAYISDFVTPIDLDDLLCQTVMPYGLAAALLVGEDDVKADLMLQKYQENIAMYGNKIPRSAVAITDVYGGLTLSEE